MTDAPRSLPVIHAEIAAVEKRLRQVISKHYGRDDVVEVLGMLQAGYEGYCDEVMSSWGTAITRKRILWHEHYAAKGIGQK